MNLTSITEEDEVIGKHFLDSLMVSRGDGNDKGAASH